LLILKRSEKLRSINLNGKELAILLKKKKI